MFEHFVVIRVAAKQPQRNGVKPRRLGREIQPGRVRATDDFGELGQSGIIELVLLEEGVEAA